jgi:hypothetical protein
VSGVPAEVETVLRRALSKRREDRFPTVTAFAQAFEEAAAGGAALEPRPTPSRSAEARPWKGAPTSPTLPSRGAR